MSVSCDVFLGHCMEFGFAVVQLDYRTGLGLYVYLDGDRLGVG